MAYSGPSIMLGARAYGSSAIEIDFRSPAETICARVVKYEGDKPRRVNVDAACLNELLSSGSYLDWSRHRASDTGLRLTASPREVLPCTAITYHTAPRLNPVANETPTTRRFIVSG